MFVVPSFPHLRDMEMDVQYREMVLPQPLLGHVPPPKWKADPDTNPNQPFGPTPSYYLNGVLLRQGQTPFTHISNTPPPVERVPRRGLMRAFPGDTDYDEICKQQGFHCSLNGHPLNGFTPPGSDVSKSANGGSPHQLPNGVSEHPSSPTDVVPHQTLA